MLKKKQSTFIKQLKKNSFTLISIFILFFLIVYLSYLILYSRTSSASQAKADGTSIIWHTNGTKPPYFYFNTTKEGTVQIFPRWPGYNGTAVVSVWFGTVRTLKDDRFAVEINPCTKTAPLKGIINRDKGGFIELNFSNGIPYILNSKTVTLKLYEQQSNSPEAISSLAYGQCDTNYPIAAVFEIQEYNPITQSYYSALAPVLNIPTNNQTKK